MQSRSSFLSCNLRGCADRWGSAHDEWRNLWLGRLGGTGSKQVLNGRTCTDARRSSGSGGVLAVRSEKGPGPGPQRSYLCHEAIFAGAALGAGAARARTAASTRDGECSGKEAGAEHMVLGAPGDVGVVLGEHGVVGVVVGEERPLAARLRRGGGGGGGEGGMSTDFSRL